MNLAISILIILSLTTCSMEMPAKTKLAEEANRDQVCTYVHILMYVLRCMYNVANMDAHKELKFIKWLYL